MIVARSRGGRGFARAAEYGAYPGHQFARIERLGQVIIGADFKAQYPVDRFSPGGQQKHGDRGLQAQRLEQLKSRAARQHHIEDDQLMIVGQSGAQARGLIVGCIHLKAFAFQKALQQIYQPVVVIDDEQAIHRIHSALPGARVR